MIRCQVDVYVPVCPSDRKAEELNIYGNFTVKTSVPEILSSLTLHLFKKKIYLKTALKLLISSTFVQLFGYHSLENNPTLHTLLFNGKGAPCSILTVHTHPFCLCHR